MDVEFDMNDVEAVKVTLLGLAVRCPIDEENLEHCPLYRIRKLPLEDRFQWVENLSHGARLKICMEHAVCLSEYEYV